DFLRLQAAFPSLELFRSSISTDARKLPDSEFKRKTFDFLRGNTDLNRLLFEFEKLLPPPKKRNRKRGKRKRTNRSRTNMQDPDRDRASEYARNQDLWRINKRRLWDFIKRGSMDSVTEDREVQFFDFFAGLFAMDSQCGLENYDTLVRPKVSITQYIASEDIEYFIRKKSKSSPGPDGLLAGQIGERLAEFVVLLNCCIMSLDIPDPWRES